MKNFFEGDLMSKIDKIKATISFLEKILITFMLALFGMISFLVINVYKLTFFQFTITIAGILIVFVILYALIRILIKKFKQLGDL